MAIEMTHTEISRRLALAIGYRPDQIDVEHRTVRVKWDGVWYRFNHLAWRDIGPIAARFKMFPHWNTQHNMWTISKIAPRGLMPTIVLHNCPATCIALAVIEASERGLL